MAYDGLAWPLYIFEIVKIVGKGGYCHKSQPQLNPNLTQPNITKVGFDMKMTFHHHPHRELNVINISAVTDTIFTKLG